MKRGPLTRTLLVSASILGVLSLGVLPPEHLHAARPHDGRHADLVHRHFESHHPLNSGTSVEDHDHEARWLDPSFTTPPCNPQGIPATSVVADVLPERPVLTRQWWTLRADHAPAHGPPGTVPSALRAPPAFSA